MKFILAIAIVVVDVYAILQIAESRTRRGVKALWIGAVLLAPVIGVIAWWLFGPKSQ